jgi:hypothetical protein
VVSKLAIRPVPFRASLALPAQPTYGIGQLEYSYGLVMQVRETQPSGVTIRPNRDESATDLRVASCVVPNVWCNLCGTGTTVL